MYQITNHDPVQPSAVNPQVPVMLDYIIAKVLAKSPEARYQSAADFANDLRECRVQMETGQLGTSAVITATRPIPPMTLATAQALDSAPEHDSDEQSISGPTPTRGISRAFDSQEATQRLMRQIGSDGTMEFVSTKSFSATTISRSRALQTGERPWGARENAIFTATVIVAIVIATTIVVL